MKSSDRTLPEANGKRPWLIRMHHRMRTVSFALVFAATGLHAADKNYGAGVWLFLVALLLVYPHFQYWRAAAAGDSIRAEMDNLLIDSLLLGVFMAAVEFAGWLSLAAAIGTLSNSATNKGWRGVRDGALALVVGVALGIAILGFRFSPDTEWPAAMLCGLGLAGYVLAMNSIAFSRNLQLRLTREKLKERERELLGANESLLQNFQEIDRLHAQLRQVKNLMSDAINFSPTFIWETDREYRFSFLQGAEKILGYSDEDMLGRKRSECLGHDADAVRALNAAMEAHRPFEHAAIAARTRSGQEIWLSSSAQAVFDQSGAFVGYRGVDVDITELTRVRHELEEMALHDPLTGLANRRKLQFRYEIEALRHQRSGNSLVLLVIDIDHFKVVNDSHGHIVGDVCLKAIADTLVAHARVVDLVARFGGEEFLVLLPDTDMDEGLVVAEKLRRAVEGSPIRAEGVAAPLSITISTGVSEIGAGREEALDRLIARADAGVFRAKKGGRNRVCRGD